MNRKLKKALKDAFDAPQPTKKTEFLSNFSYPKATYYEFFISQIGFIRIRFWFLSVLFLLFMAGISLHIRQDKEIVGIVSSALPLLTLIGITEINKSASFHMNELEASCRYNLSTITLIRLSIIGSFHFIILLLSLFLFKGQSQYGLIRYSLYIVTPFLLSSYLSFWITNHLKAKDTMYICSGVTAFISVIILMLNYNNSDIYNDAYPSIWGMVFVVTAVLLVKEIHFLIKGRTKQWSFV